MRQTSHFLFYVPTRDINEDRKVLILAFKKKMVKTGGSESTRFTTYVVKRYAFQLKH